MKKKLLSFLADNGLKGLETNFASYSNKEQGYLRNLADNYSLIKTGGSDWHGEGYGEIKEFGIETKTKNVNIFLKKLEAVNY